MKILVLLSLILVSTSLRLESFPKLTIWNVGQGQWVTLSTYRYCYHIDVGGETVDWLKIMKTCGRKKNFIIFTHYDWDHISFTGQLLYRIPNTCLLSPIHYSISKRKSKMFEKLTACKESITSITTVYGGSSKSANHQSKVFNVMNNFLIPGDSPRSLEKKWLYKASKQINTLILGHHGSHTSTSQYLLKNFKIKQALVSARKKKYGHPHKKVIQRLKKNKTPLVDTENWGNIHIHLIK